MDLELNVAICDDEMYYRHHIKKCVRDYLTHQDVLFQIELFESGSDFCGDEENIRKFDVIFLDIEMPDMNGMETAHFIRRQNTEMDIVFITITPDYVFEGYEVRAVRYIMKDDVDRLLPECLEDILRERKLNGQEMEFSFTEGKRVVLLRNILYIESKSHKLVFVGKSRALYMYGRIQELEARLKEFNFVRCHQSFLVNFEHVEKIRNYVIYLSNGAEIPASRSRYSEVKQMYLSYKEI